MPKYLKAAFPKRCIGCEMCVMEMQLQLKKAGLDGSLIRILRKLDGNKNLIFDVDIDPQINNLDIKKIKEICPTLVFSIEEEEEAGELSN